MTSNPKRYVHTILTLLLLSSPLTLGGSIELTWTPSPGATGYRVYFGSASGQYDQFLDVGNAREARLVGLADCRNWYLAVKPYNEAGEAVSFSNEISGWPRPTLGQFAPEDIVQGTEFTLSIAGSNFQSGAELRLTPSPTDIYDNPLFRLDTVDVVSCTEIQARFTVEATDPGNRAMEVGPFDVEVEVLNPGMVYRASDTSFDVQFNRDRWDLNQSEPSTVDRIDGSDLTWLAFAFGNIEGDELYNPDADLDGDGLVDGEDLALLAAGFGLCWSGTDWTSEACS